MAERKSIESIMHSLTLKEKISLCSGSDFWHTEPIEKKDIPSIMVSDGPHGLRKMKLEEDSDINGSIKAVCFPTAASLASSFDVDLVRSVGQALGEECQAENVAVLLGPGNNIKRSPLCGRNFEYFSEDPYLAGKIAAAHINGVQCAGVGASLKHFLANNQELYRNTYNAIIDERTLREIYLTGFEIAVKESQPWTVMCSYNKVNGEQSSQNKRTLTDILRDEWGFEGLVVSDWGAIKERAKAIAAGLDLEMPGNDGASDDLVMEAIQSGELSEDELDKCVERVLTLVFKAIDSHDDSIKWDKNAHHLLARKVAAECMVLLKNEDKVLPLEESDHIAIIGGFAKKPRFQGGGSSHINCTQIDSAMTALAGNTHIIYEEGFEADSDKYDEKKFRRAIDAARTVDKCVIFAGLPDSYECEGYDRKHMDLPEVQNRLIEEVSKVCEHVIVVLHNGSPVTIPWLDKVQGLLEAYLAGQGTGSAVMDVLYGRVNPSGRLAETFPLRLEDNPSYLDFGTGCKDIEYREGVFVGYRYYTAKKLPVLFPFGYGLSYTRFSYGNMKIDMDKMMDDDEVEVCVDVINEGEITGKDVVQLYVSPKMDTIRRPVRELKGFKKITVKPGERKTVRFTLNKRSFAYYNTEINDWYVEPGEYEIQICRDADTVAVSKTITVNPVVPCKKEFSLNSNFEDVFANEKATRLFRQFVDEHKDRKATVANAMGGAFDVFIDPATGDFFLDMPIRMLANMGDGRVSVKKVLELIDKMNEV